MYVVPIRQAIRQIKRWLFASEYELRTGGHPGIALLHANYAVGDLDLLGQMYTDQQIREATGDIRLGLLRQAQVLQDKAQRKVTQLCPRLTLYV